MGLTKDGNVWTQLNVEFQRMAAPLSEQGGLEMGCGMMDLFVGPMTADSAGY